MNYRHIYHAGNFADIFKHLLLTMTLGYLQNKDKPLFALDAFGGLGLYDLNADAAQRTLEYAEGVENFMASVFSNPDLQDFQRVLRPYWEDRTYPGSPLLIAQSLRPQDRGFANELHPEDFATLKSNLRGFKTFKSLHLDAYDAIRGALPPPEKRGLILVDPPFEKKDEFEILARQIEEWQKRFATGCYMIWYPIKAHSATHELFEAAKQLGFSRVWVGEFLKFPRNKPDSFNGCGVMILNTPFQIPERVEALAEELRQSLNGVEIVSQWLTEQ